MEKPPISKNAEFVKFTSSLLKSQKEICNILMGEIDKILPNATSKIYYSNPVWFIDDNPIVGYNVVGNGISLLFWSGQSFKTPGLLAAGKFKAAKITYAIKSEIDLTLLRGWLRESVEIQWDYKNIRKTGILTKISGFSI